MAATSAPAGVQHHLRRQQLGDRIRVAALTGGS